MYVCMYACMYLHIIKEKIIFSFSNIYLNKDRYIVSQVAWWGKNPPAMQETWVLSRGQEDPLKEGMVNHSSIPAWKIPCKEPSELQSIGLQRVRCD